MKNRAEILGEFVIDLAECKSGEEKFSILEKYIRQSGFESIIYTYIPSYSLPEPIKEKLAPCMMLSKSYPEKFLEQYVEESFDQHDFTIKKIRNGDLSPINWWQYEAEYGLSKEEKNVITVARSDFSITNGLSIPTQSNKKGIAGASLICSSKDKGFDLLVHERLFVVSRIIRLFHNDIMMENDFIKQNLLSGLPLLSKKEIQVIRFLISGYPMKQIEDHTGITYRYANKLLEKVRGKFGGLSKDQLIYTVAQLDVLRLKDDKP